MIKYQIEEEYKVKISAPKTEIEVGEKIEITAEITKGDIKDIWFMGIYSSGGATQTITNVKKISSFTSIKN